MAGKNIQLLVIVAVFIRNISAGTYIMADYYMDPAISSTFGGICEEFTQDDAAFINSHMNVFSLTKYKNNKKCWMTCDAGSVRGSRYRVEILRWTLEDASINTNVCDADHVEFYDGRDQNNTTLIGRYCGSEAPNLTVAGRYLTISFSTDSKGTYSGFRLMVIRSEPPPCQEHEYLCTAEGRCIDIRLHCDGTDHCIDGRDEAECTALQRFVGTFLALGMAGLVGVGVAVVTGCALLWTITCCCLCCKKKNRETGDVGLSRRQVSPLHEPPVDYEMEDVSERNASHGK